MGKFNSVRKYLSILCRMFKVGAGESQSALVYLCSVYAKQVSILNKIARGRVMSAPENSLLEGLGYSPLIIDWCRLGIKILSLQLLHLAQIELLFWPEYVNYVF